LDQVMALDTPEDDPWLRVLLTGSVPAGVAEMVRERLGDGVVDVRLDTRDAPTHTTTGERIGRPPQELFAAFLEERQIEDERIPTLFADLMDEEWARSGGDEDKEAAGAAS
jgi:exonuclease SbcD